MIRYIHGSEDSLDLDVFYVFDKMPSFAECRKFCSEDSSENRNIIVVKDGVVSECFMGTVDEVNNAFIDTYDLHKQDYLLIIRKRLERNHEIKAIRATRGILSLISKTSYRSIVKEVLSGSWSDRLQALLDIDYSTIDFTVLDKQLDGTHIKKVIAFQIGQTLGLLDGIELYTKSSVANQYPLLKSYLYREDVDSKILDDYIKILVSRLSELEYEDIPGRIVMFKDSGRKYELKHETIV